MQVRDPRGEILGEHARAPADLDHDILGGELGDTIDHTEDVGVHEEVLPELAIGADPELAQAAQAGLGGLIRHDPAHQPKTRAAVRSTTPPSSAASTPRRAPPGRPAV